MPPRLLVTAPPLQPPQKCAESLAKFRMSSDLTLVCVSSAGQRREGSDMDSIESLAPS